MSLPTGHKLVSLTPRQQELNKLFAGHLPGACILEPGGWFLQTAHQKYCQQLKDFQFEENDIVVVTMPKSGTTWMQEIVWTMLKNPDLNNPAAKQPLNLKSPALGFMFTYCVGLDLEKLLGNETFAGVKAELSSDPDKGIWWPHIRDSERPRIIKTHYSFPFISDTALTKAKTVYTIRDPRDVCISYYNFTKVYKFDDFTGTFDQFVDAFLDNIVLFGPYWSHVKEAWDRRHNPNLHIVFYEKMKKNPKDETAKLNTFLGTNLDDDHIEKIVHYTSFVEMKKREGFVISDEEKELLEEQGVNPAINKLFINKGVSGVWKNVLSQEQQDKFEVWIKKNCPDMEIMECFLNP